MRVGSEQPFLFFPEGPDVRWRSFATVAEQAAAGRRALEAIGLVPAAASARDRPAVVTYTWAGGLAGADAVAADLAIRSGGWTAAPVPSPAAPGSAGDPLGRRGSGNDLQGKPALRPPAHDARLLLPWEAAPAANAPAEETPRPPEARLPAAGKELGRRGGRGSGDEPLGALSRPPGGALVRTASPTPGEAAGGDDDGWRVVSSGQLREAAESLDRALRPAAPPGESALPGSGRRPSRPVVAAWLDPSLADGRALLEWATTTAAALYLEPERGVLGGAAAWVRPTLVAGDSFSLAAVAADLRRRQGGRGPLARLARLGRWARRLRRAGPRPPFGRLRAAVLLGSSPLVDENRALFEERGVAVVRPPVTPG